MYDIETLTSSDMIEKYKGLAQKYTEEFDYIERAIKALIVNYELVGTLTYKGITYNFDEEKRNLIGTVTNYMEDAYYNEVTMQRNSDGSSMIFNIHFGKSDYNDITNQSTNLNLSNVRFIYNESDREINNLKVTDCTISKNNLNQSSSKPQFTKK